MKKLLTLSLLFLCSFCSKDYSESSMYATTWGGTASNQGITYTAMNNLYTVYGGYTGGNPPFCDGGTIPANSLRLVTVSSFSANWCNIGVVYVIPTKSSTQVLVKRDIGFQLIIRRNTSQSDCTGFGALITVYVNSDFTKAYSNSAQTTTYNGGGNSYVTSSIQKGSVYSYLIIDASGNITTFTLNRRKAPVFRRGI